MQGLASPLVNSVSQTDQYTLSQLPPVPIKTTSRDQDTAQHRNDLYFRF